MEATLKFNLPEEQGEFEAASHGIDYQILLQGLDNDMRGWLKYGHSFATADDAIAKIRGMLFESGLTIWD